MINETIWEQIDYIPIDELSSYPDIILSSFDCGNRGLNNFLTMKAKPDHDEMLGATTLIIDKLAEEIIGYYTLKNSCLFYTESEQQMDRMAIPTTEIVMLAIHKDYQSKGIGSEILKSIIFEVQEYSFSFSSSKAITLYAINNGKCIEFYEKMNFQKLDSYMGLVYDKCRNETVPMFLRLG